MARWLFCNATGLIFCCLTSNAHTIRMSFALRGMGLCRKNTSGLLSACVWGCGEDYSNDVNNVYVSLSPFSFFGYELDVVGYQRELEEISMPGSCFHLILKLSFREFIFLNLSEIIFLWFSRIHENYLLKLLKKSPLFSCWWIRISIWYTHEISFSHIIEKCLFFWKLIQIKKNRTVFVCHE